MPEWHFPADVHTFEFHEHRERAAHLEDPWHRARLLAVRDEVLKLDADSVSDLGCGDGGLLSLLTASRTCWGYDFAPANAGAWTDRGVEAFALDVFNDRDFPANVRLGEVIVLTEVLEHVADPHGVLQSIHDAAQVRFVVASSPHNETGLAHNECHQWAWDFDGYRALFEAAGFNVRTHRPCEWSQILVGEK